MPSVDSRIFKGMIEDIAGARLSPQEVKKRVEAYTKRAQDAGLQSALLVQKDLEKNEGIDAAMERAKRMEWAFWAAVEQVVQDVRENLLLEFPEGNESDLEAFGLVPDPEEEYGRDYL